jgi:hypothetical protein
MSELCLSSVLWSPSFQWPRLRCKTLTHAAHQIEALPDLHLQHWGVQSMVRESPQAVMFLKSQFPTQILISPFRDTNEIYRLFVSLYDAVSS